MSSFACRDRTHTESEPEVVPGSLAVKGELVEVLVGIQRAVHSMDKRGKSVYLSEIEFSGLKGGCGRPIILSFSPIN